MALKLAFSYGAAMLGADAPDCSARPDGAVGEWAQCGGVGCDGQPYEATCADDLVCTKSTQCAPRLQRIWSAKPFQIEARMRKKRYS